MRKNIKSKRVTLYIDAANLILSAKSMNIGFEIFELLSVLKYKYNVKKCVYFTGKILALSTDYELLEKMGVEIIFKKIYDDFGKTKANCDVEISHRITVDVLNKLVDEVVLISGDGDFYSLLEFVEREKVDVKLLGVYPHTTSKLYRNGNKFSLSFVSELVKNISVKRKGLIGLGVPTSLLFDKNSITQVESLSRLSRYKKTVLFFGDSLTFCYDAATRDRTIFEERWTSIVEEQLAERYRFIIEGQGGRTVDNDDKVEGRNGVKAFTQVLYSHYYVDIIFIMLGTNELKDRFRTDAETIANKYSKIKKIIDIWKEKPRLNVEFPLKVVLVAPPIINQSLIPFGWGIENAQEVSNDMSAEYDKIAVKLGWDYLDASKIKISSVDGIHLDKKGNEELAKLVINFLQN